MFNCVSPNFKIVKVLFSFLAPCPPLNPGTQAVGWEDGAHATIRIRPDVPLVGLAHFAGDILEKVVGASSDAELSVQIEYGF